MVNLGFAIASLFLASCASSHGEVAPWSKFLSDPSEENYRLAKRIIESEDDCNQDWYSSSEHAEPLSSLFESIGQGNKYSFDIGLQILDCLGGGNLGDAYRAMGLFFENKPSYFSKTISDNNVSDVNLKNMLVMLPLHTTDDIPEKIRILENRIRALSGLEGSVDQAFYSKALSILTKELKFYRDFG